MATAEFDGLLTSDSAFTGVEQDAPLSPFATEEATWQPGSLDEALRGSWRAPLPESEDEGAYTASLATTEELAAAHEWEDPYPDVDNLIEASGTEEEAGAGIAPSAWQPLVRMAIASGLRDKNHLTNLVFFALHPERQGRKLAPNEPNYPSLSTEWLRIRDTAVAPALVPARGATPSRNMYGAGPLTIVATSLPSGATQNRYGIPETIEALAWIQKEWARRHPEVQFGVRDISRQGGGRLGKHKSHRVGLDADVILVVNGKRVGVANPDYERQRPLVQDLVEVIRANPVLPIKTIGFLDPKLKGVAPWPGHTKHLHVRFCRPERHTAELDLDRVYAKGEAKPSYDCGLASEFEDGHLDLYYEYDDKDEATGDAESSLLRPENPMAETFAGHDVEQLRFREGEAEGILEPLGRGVTRVFEPLGRAVLSAFPQWRSVAEPIQQAIKVERALQAGNRDENDLTDLVYFDRFPTHLGRRPLPEEPGFAKWSEIRETFVRPLLWGHIRTTARERAYGEWHWWRDGRRLEDEAGAVQARLTSYWAATPRMPVGAAIWQESWSAAFISWVLYEAGVRAPFPFHSAHRVYVHWAIRNAVDRRMHPIKAFPADGHGRVKPREGDLVCTWRGKPTTTPPTTYAELAGMPQPPAGRILHCDLVSDVASRQDPDYIYVIGGNKGAAHGVVCPLNPHPDGCTVADQAAGQCGCTVNRARHRLDPDGFLANNPRWVAIVRIGP